MQCIGQARWKPAWLALIAGTVQDAGTLRTARASCPLTQIAVKPQQVVVQSWIGKQFIAHGALSEMGTRPLSMRRQ